MKRSIYLEPGDNCILHRASQNIRLEIFENGTEIDLRPLFDEGSMFEDFVFTDEMISTCNEFELSIYITIIIIVIFIILVSVLIIACCFSRNYKRKYYELSESEHAMKDIG